jgi:putative transcriptional regulator
MEFQSLANHLLIAMPGMLDPNFQRTVTLLCQHDADGSLGVVVNRQIDNLCLGDILRQFDIEQAASERRAAPVYAGGPVHTELGLVLHRRYGDWDSTLTVGPELALTTSVDILHAISSGTGPGDAILVLGYAGWGAGQLEQEIQENAWLSVPADPGIIFDTPVADRWDAAARLLGVDLSTLSTSAGHA